MNRFLVLIFLFYVMAFKSAKAQVGPQPSYVNWSSIENNSVRVIFPDHNLKEAQRIADIITHVSQKATVSIGSKSKKIDLLLNTNTTQVNGYATLKPYHSQFYATGAQNFNMIGALSWLDNLAIHEYRHSLQYCNADRGLTKMLRLIRGDEGWGMGMAPSIPDWFDEGDAVLAETILSPAGRGRTPSFFEEQRALLLNGKNYSYAQARNGSLKNLIPNHYSLGYTLVNYVRNHYGAETWSKVLADAGAYKYPPYPFSRSLKHYTGLSTPKLYKASYQELKERWEKELDNLKLTPTMSVSLENPKVVTNYLFPHFLADGSIVCLKNSYDEISQLVKIKDGLETRLTSVGRGTEPFLGLQSNKATWTEMRKDARRDAVEYSVIMSFDLASGVKKQVTNKSKYFSPVFSSAGDRLLAVEANEQIKNNIKILNAADGLVIETIPNEQNDFLSYSQWINDDSGITYLAKRNSRVCLLKYDLISKKTTELTDWTSHVIGAYTVQDDWVYFNASFSGINNIYAVSTNGDKQIYQMTSVRVGADMPAVSKDGRLLAFTEQTVMGKQLSSLSVSKDALTLSPVQVVEPADMARYHVLTTAEEQNILDSIPQEAYQVRKYNGLLPGVKLHSWDPVFSFEPDSRRYGAFLKMSDILGNFSANIGPVYNVNERTVHVGGDFTYSKYYLPITARANSGNRKSKSLAADGKTVVERTFKQTDIGAGLSLPLSWYRGNYTTGVKLNTFISNISTSNYVQNFNSAQADVMLYNIRNRGLQNTNSKWSQLVQLGYERSLNKEVSADRFTLKANVTTIGLRKNHGLAFGFKLLKEQNSNNYLYEDLFEHARGYEANPRDLEHVFSVDYSMPLFYPDFGFGGLFYLKRVRANFFYDMGRIYRNVNNAVLNQNSVGAEIMLDTKFLNLSSFGKSLGFRTSYLFDKDATKGSEKLNFSIFVTVGL